MAALARHMKRNVKQLKTTDLSEFSMIYDPKRLLYKHKASLVKEITHLYLPGK